jgi:GLE1-like protein
VAAEVSQAITQARHDDAQIKQALERKDPGFTPDMARGGRYLVDLLACNTIQRIQGDGFNGPRGDGFPLASMLTMVSLEHKELVPILAAHVYSVCPTAIPTLPSPKKDATEDELMESLGMQKDKNGEFETFDKFLSRTEVRCVPIGTSCEAGVCWISYLLTLFLLLITKRIL